MSIYITRPEPQENPIPAVRTDPAKRALLKAAVEVLLQPIADTKAAVEDGAKLDVFAMAVALKNQIKAGTLALQYGDYDGTDITECISEILASA
jgi:hypothetical protein